MNLSSVTPPESLLPVTLSEPETAVSPVKPRRRKPPLSPPQPVPLSPPQPAPLEPEKPIETETEPEMSSATEASTASRVAPKAPVRKKAVSTVQRRVPSNGRNVAVLFTLSPQHERKVFSSALPPEGNREIAANLIVQTLIKLAEFSEAGNFDVIVATDAHLSAEVVFQHGGAVLLQRGRTFGTRLANVVADVLALGYEKISVVGNDCPMLSHRDFQKSFGFISDTSVVLGPAKDGGIYLLGLPRTFLESNVELAKAAWKQSSLFTDLIASFTGQNFDVLLLREKQDLDTLSDLANFIHYFDNSDEPSF